MASVMIGSSKNRSEYGLLLGRELGLEDRVLLTMWPIPNGGSDSMRGTGCTVG